MLSESFSERSTIYDENKGEWQYQMGTFHQGWNVTERKTDERMTVLKSATDERCWHKSNSNVAETIEVHSHIDRYSFVSVRCST